jgi:hypothetical protein
MIAKMIHGRDSDDLFKFPRDGDLDCVTLLKDFGLKITAA